MVARRATVPLITVLREWGRIGVIGFGGPPAHIALLRELVVERRGWMPAREFEDANAACQLLPGPASTQMSIYCARRVAGNAGALAGGLAFILPGLVLTIAIAAVALQDDPPAWVRGLGAGAAAAVVAVVAQAGFQLAAASFEGRSRGGLARALAYALLGGAATVAVGPYVVLVLLACGLVELGLRRSGRARRPRLAAGAAARGHRRRGAAGARLDRAEGRRALVRRRLRDRAADAGRRARRTTGSRRPSSPTRSPTGSSRPAR